MTELNVTELSPAAFAPFGSVGRPAQDGAPGRADIPLDLSQGVPRFYIMHLEERGLAFSQMARHDKVTQCLGSVDGRPWLIAVAPARIAEPASADIRAFRIPGGQFIMLAHGTWHAGPYFTEKQRDFYNLELADTNIADYTVRHFDEPLRFAP